MLNHTGLRLVLACFVSLIGYGCDSFQPSGPRTRTTVTFAPYEPDDIRARAPLAPQQQPADLGHCRIELDRSPGFMDAVGWFQVVADTPGATVRIVSSLLYGIKPDGSVEVIGGGVAWAGLYSRDPWFPPGDRHTSLGANDRYIVPTRRDVLHGGSNHASLEGYTDAIYVVVVETTGDARVQVGIDYRQRADVPVIRERALSDWFRGDGRTPPTARPTRGPPRHRAAFPPSAPWPFRPIGNPHHLRARDAHATFATV